MHFVQKYWKKCNRTEHTGGPETCFNLTQSHDDVSCTFQCGTHGYTLCFWKGRGHKEGIPNLLIHPIAFCCRIFNYRKRKFVWNQDASVCAYTDLDVNMHPNCVWADKKLSVISIMFHYGYFVCVCVSHPGRQFPQTAFSVCVQCLIWCLLSLRQFWHSVQGWEPQSSLNHLKSHMPHTADTPTP